MKGKNMKTTSKYQLNRFKSNNFLKSPIGLALDFMFNGKFHGKKIAQLALNIVYNEDLSKYHWKFIKYGSRHADNFKKIFFLKELKRRNEHVQTNTNQNDWGY